MVAMALEIAARFGVDNVSAPIAQTLAKTEALKRLAPLAGRRARRSRKRPRSTSRWEESR